MQNVSMQRETEFYDNKEMKNKKGGKTSYKL